jgi:copper chaperone CopZ
MMKQEARIQGMTCSGCVASVKQTLEAHPSIRQAEIELTSGKVSLEVEETVSSDSLQALFPEKYIVVDLDRAVSEVKEKPVQSKWRQLRPLWLVFSGILITSLLLNSGSWQRGSIMLDSMGLFYLVFGFFKLLDYKNFPASFRMYDPLAKAVPAYAWAYPFIELVLAALFLSRFAVPLALWLTLVILGITTYGVLKVLRSNTTIQCACLGTALKLPMTEATLIENLLMIALALWMLPAYGYLL